MNALSSIYRLLHEIRKLLPRQVPSPAAAGVSIYSTGETGVTLRSTRTPCSPTTSLQVAPH